MQQQATQQPVLIDGKEIGGRPSRASRYADSVFLALAGFLFPGLGHLLVGRYATGVLLMLVACLGYAVSVPVGVALHALGVLHMLFLTWPGPRWRDPGEAARLERGRRGTDSSRTSVFIHIILLHAAGFFIPGLGHLLMKRYRTGGILCVATCLGYVAFIIPGIVLHVLSIIHIWYLTIGERSQLEAIVDLCGVLGIELPHERRAWLDALKLEQLSVLRTHLQAHRSWPGAASKGVTTGDASGAVLGTENAVAGSAPDSGAPATQLPRSRLIQHPAFLAFTNVLVPGLGHLLMGNYQTGVEWFAATIISYLAFRWVGLTPHVWAITHVVYLAFLAQSRRAVVVNMCQLLNIELNPVQLDWISTARPDHVSALCEQLKAHRAWPH